MEILDLNPATNTDESSILDQEGSSINAPALGDNAADLLNNEDPIADDFETLSASPYFGLLQNLRGNILKGHGRDFSVNIFLQFSENAKIPELLKNLTERLATSAYTQIKESNQFNKFKIPGSMFGNLFLTKKAYLKLGFKEEELLNLFNDPVENASVPVFPQNSSFLGGMLNAAEDLGDLPVNLSQMKENSMSSLQKHHLNLKPDSKLDPLEKAYLSEAIDAMLLLADDDENFLLRQSRSLISELESNNEAQVLCVELGKALRNQDNEGIEHFGYVDGRSQPLYLASDFKGLVDGKIFPDKTKERINEKALRMESGDIDIWNPFAKLNNVLVEDKAAKVPNAFGSYFVFRKLEQDVMRFTMQEQLLADELGLEGSERERAGAMAVGRFRDGTPLVLSETDGLIPAKANNFRYDGLDEALNTNPKSTNDRLGLKCPFQAHIRKTSPRQSIDDLNDNLVARKQQEDGDRGRSITRRGIPYGDRVNDPNEFQVLDDLPTKDVGLLFACFQSSIAKQFAFMQKTWANNANFRVPTTGIDPIVGQPLDLPTGNPDPNWRKEFGGDPGQNPQTLREIDLKQSHSTKFCFSNFVKFRGGEFFFAPSIPFLKNDIFPVVSIISAEKEE